MTLAQQVADQMIQQMYQEAKNADGTISNYDVNSYEDILESFEFEVKRNLQQFHDNLEQ